ncbi:hypothetical protein HJFPF1_03728 [Paramyrothecium foliicola]|nr:hypothetical protein HJFPF1_03728 [Paramyrothecium foliicola]
MSRGPLPSQLCLLSTLPQRAQGDKVRFLGWYVSFGTTQLESFDCSHQLIITATSVTSYSIHTGTLTVCHSYPQDNNVVAVVDLDLVLESLNHEITQVGEWINLIGYVTPKPRSTAVASHVSDKQPVYIQALLVWSTGPFEIKQYEAMFQITETNGNN